MTAALSQYGHYSCRNNTPAASAILYKPLQIQQTPTFSCIVYISTIQTVIYIIKQMTLKSKYILYICFYYFLRQFVVNTNCSYFWSCNWRKHSNVMNNNELHFRDVEAGVSWNHARPILFATIYTCFRSRTMKYNNRTWARKKWLTT